MVKRVVITSILVIVGFLAVFYAGHYVRGDSASHSRTTIEIEGERWAEAYTWQFDQGYPPDGWGWGEWDLVTNCLELRDADGDPTVYFIPWTHGEEFVLETEVRLFEGPGTGNAIAHLITRDSENLVHETGMVIVADSREVYLRHRVDRSEYAGDWITTGIDLAYGQWYLWRLVVRAGRVTAYLDGVKVWDTEAHHGGFYGEPHLAVENGTARFKYLRILSPA